MGRCVPSHRSAAVLTVVLAATAAALLASTSPAFVAHSRVSARTVTTKPAPPRLGREWAPGQKGYGRVRPKTVFNGGDPTGLVEHIHWTHWGRQRAVGVGKAEYVWPGTSVADNGFTGGARVVAFHLGTCRGRRAYKAIQWYFPKYGEKFDPKQYINICSGDYVGADTKPADCPDVPLATGGATATEVQVLHMPCKTASELIAAAPAAQYVVSGGRFVQSGFRCGTMGNASLDSALFICDDGRREFLYQLA